MTVFKHFLLLLCLLIPDLYVMALHGDKTERLGNSLVVQWLGLGAFTVMAWGSISGLRTRIPQRHGQKKAKKQKNPKGVNFPKQVLLYICLSLAKLPFHQMTLAIYLPISCLNHKGGFLDAISILPVMVSMDR